jgi:hypothetical protein
VRENQAPIVDIRSPNPGQSFEAFSDVRFRVTARDPERGEVKGIVFFRTENGQLIPLWADAEPPYEFTWQDVPPGTYEVGAAATDEHDAVGIARVRIRVRENQAPIVDLRSPNPGQSFEAFSDVTFRATARDPERGEVKGIVFFRTENGQLVPLGSDTEAPYEFTWQDVPPGTYEVGAAATDEHDAAGIVRVRIRVRPSGT